MDALLFAANAVLPVILLTAVGYFVKRIGLVGKGFITEGNRLCFRVLLPVLLFSNVYKSRGLSFIRWDIVAFVCVSILAAFALGLLIVARFIPERQQKGVVLQCIFRSNFAMIGLPLATAMMGDAAAEVAAVISLFAIPMFNILAVLSLRMFQHAEAEKPDYKSMAISILKNPLILGVVVGFVSLCIRMGFENAGIAFRLTDVSFLYEAIQKIASMASPLSLLVLGARFEFSAIRGMLKPIAVGTVMRIVVVPLLALTSAVVFFPSFGGPEIAALLALYGSPVAISSQIMAAEMNGDADLAGQLVVWTTLFSAITLFLFTFVFRLIGIF